MATAAKYERQVFYGTAGTTAATQITELIEATVNKPKEYDPTDIRGDGTVIPVASEQPVMRSCEVTFKMRHVKASTDVAALLAIANHVSAPVIALKVVSYSGGATEFDGDVTLDLNKADANELEFTAHPSREGGRAPVF